MNEWLILKRVVTELTFELDDKKRSIVSECAKNWNTNERCGADGNVNKSFGGVLRGTIEYVDAIFRENWNW